jgi:hypothetical protein
MACYRTRLHIKSRREFSLRLDRPGPESEAFDSSAESTRTRKEGADQRRGCIGQGMLEHEARRSVRGTYFRPSFSFRQRLPKSMASLSNIGPTHIPVPTLSGGHGGNFPLSPTAGSVDASKPLMRQLHRKRHSRHQYLGLHAAASLHTGRVDLAGPKAY